MSSSVQEETAHGESNGVASSAASSMVTPKSSALQNKITSILSSSYADLEVRDSLETLDARGLKNTPDTRRNLRLDAQHELIECNGEIVQDFGQVARQLRNVGAALASLQQTCAEMRKHISTARIETAPLLDEATRLMRQKDEVETRQSILQRFNSHFLLSEEELRALTFAADPVDDDFFSALVKAKKIHKDCQILLGGENQRLGLEILDQSSKNLNAGFQKLYRWIQREFKALDLESPQMSPSIRRAIRVLAERPALFQSCLEIFAQSREQNLSDLFYNALTGSETGQKPIEFSTHEPLRYVGDMLAWAHSTTVSERESLESLFVAEGQEIARGIQEGLESDPWLRNEEEQEPFDGRKALQHLVNRSLSGVSQVLKQRIDQVIHTHDEPVLAYKISNLLAFYRNIFQKLLNHGSFMEMLEDLGKGALKQFRDTMKYQVTNLQPDRTAVSEELAVPGFVNDALESLKALLKSYDTSTATLDDQGAGLELVLQEALDPYTTACEKLSNELEVHKGYVFMINVLLAVKTTLDMFPFARKKSASSKESIEDYASKLVDHQHSFFLQSSGLDSLVSALESFEEEQDIRDLPAFAPEPLRAASEQLDDFLPSAFMDTSENVKHLGNSTLMHKITAEAAERFCDDFETIEARIIDTDEASAQVAEPTNAPRRRLREQFPRTSEEIRILLS